MIPDVMWLHPKIFNKYLETLSAEDREYVLKIAVEDETGWICVVKQNAKQA